MTCFPSRVFHLEPVLSSQLLQLFPVLLVGHCDAYSEGLFSRDRGVPRSLRTPVRWKGRLATSVPAPSSVRTSGRQLEWASGKQEWCNISLCTGSSALAEVYVHSRSKHNHLKKQKQKTPKPTTHHWLLSSQLIDTIILIQSPCPKPLTPEPWRLGNSARRWWSCSLPPSTGVGQGQSCDAGPPSCALVLTVAFSPVPCLTGTGDAAQGEPVSLAPLCTHSPPGVRIEWH